MATVPAAPRAFGGCGLSAAHQHKLFASRRFPLCRNPAGRFAARPGKGFGTLSAVCRPHSSRKAAALQYQCRWDFSDIRFSDGLRSFPQLIS